MRYAIWNNKGGVGKSFLTFIFATEYAATYPDRQVCVVDMCPQANVSEIFLGGNGAGADRLNEMLSRTHRKTIGGYFDSRITQPHAWTGSETDVLVPAYNANHSLPQNIMLVTGDPSLEVQAEAMNQIANLSLPQDSWRNVHSWLADLCSAIEAKHPGTTFFIDCNPEFLSLHGARARSGRPLDCAVLS